MRVKLLQQWRDSQIGAEIEVNERVGAELITAGFAELCNNEVTDFRSIKNSLGFKQSSLKMTETMIGYHTNELEKLEKKKELILKEIDDTELALLEEDEDKDVKESKKTKKAKKEE